MSEKKKILFVVHQLNYGGVQKAILSALDAVDYSKNEVTLYVRKNRVQLLPDVNKNVSKIIVNEDKTRYYRKPYMLFLLICEKISKLIRRDEWSDNIHQKLVTYLNESQMRYEKEHYFNDGGQYDVAISYIQGYTGQFVAQFIEAKKKYMFYHSSIDERHELHEKILSYYDAIVAVSEKNANMLEKLYPSNAVKFTSIDNYVNAFKIRERAKKGKSLKKDEELTLCSCGRLSSEKGFDMAVRAAEILREKGISFYWYFVGDGAERIRLEQMICESDLDDYIEITGMQDNPYVFINECDIYVQPSYEESYGLTIAEAKILLKPVVSTRTVGASGQIEHMKNGILTDISAEEIANGIIQYIGDTKLKESVIHNLERIDYAEIFREYQIQWEKLLEG